ncbi:lipoprotein-anchoring transpeptidase ErfK/SrfK [Rhizobium sp. ERR 922]|uniref:L,D-transpeptidase n=1 Tax=unclassified Rhizobium TaxID=2613769 RepID=UPI0011A9BB18|nr:MULTISPECIES: L,D-transpeptidase [unclassified Rhizobium]TWB61488.1 lipoprotein-anchoring transpeptidase ErfK/SrfK [Rhizobium sp. ERR 922]TWC04414.1 lipoprotein-anchoring transpeptidase ErfK/SrfK [Rhizobium sp. ERR 942]
MNRFVKLSFALATTAAVSALALTDAQAQYYRSGNGNTVLVTPDGRILDQYPYGGGYSMARDGRGRRVLIDAYGNIVATEMKASTYYPRAPASDSYADNGSRYGDTQLSNNGNYQDYRQYRTDSYGNYDGAPNNGYDQQDRGVITGGIPRDSDIQRQPLDNQPLPGKNQGQANQNGSDYASIDPQQGAPDIVNKPAPAEPVITLKGKSKMEITALEVFLARQGISPGAIDGRMGANVTKAIYAYQQMTGQTLDPNNTDAILEQLRMSGGMPIVNYTITAADAAGPYVASIPEDYAAKSQMPSLGYTSTTEMLAERFHMDEGYLKALNPGVDFTVPGSIIKVVNTGPGKTGTVAKILADKGRKQVFAYDANGTLIAAYPASIGSADTPSPSGTVTVERVAFNPGYTYNPKINFQQGANDKVLNIPPGPNGPVGTVWMALSKPTYGIHGTPDPSRIGKSQSHGCVRLTNWDATELAKMVKPGVVVEFVD